MTRLFDNPQSTEKTVKPIKLTVNTRTAPKRPASQPVSGTQMASATAYEVMTQVPCELETAKPPVICGKDTLAMVISSTTIKFASATTKAANSNLPPFKSP